MWVFDASTLILLARVDLLDLFLDRCPDAVAIPEAVKTECRLSERRSDAVVIGRMIKGGRIRVFKVRGKSVVARLQRDFALGLGEAEAIALGLGKMAMLVVTDDRNAIRACRLLKQEFVTALGILVQLKELHALTREEALRRLERLAVHGRYSKRILLDVKERLGGT